ncbi:MAG TPA: DUF2064 domain-containing protein [Acidimicrobiales bacterium]|jgi:hypothetical protein|nr:DUF2064 domain-containing protein [Acidimicrobiales bacterium]
MSSTPWPIHLLVIAKTPIPGLVKTRLCPPLTHEQAAEVALAAILDTLDAVTGANVVARSIILDGEPGPWVPPGMCMIPQRTGPFADRLAGAMEDAFAATPLPMLLIGMDTPQVRTDQLESGAAALLADGVDTTLGLAEDGGFWVIGTREPVVGMFEGIPMSTTETGARQHAHLHSLGLSCVTLPILQDVDEFSDAQTVASLIPHSRFASALGSCHSLSDYASPVDA